MQDSAITTSLPVLDLVDSIKPGAVMYENVGSGDDEAVCMCLCVFVCVVCVCVCVYVYVWCV